MATELILSRLDRTEVDPLKVNLAVLKRACSGHSYGGVSREVRERAGEGERVGNAFLRSLSPFHQPLAYLSAHLSLRRLLSERLKQVILKLY